MAWWHGYYFVLLNKSPNFVSFNKRTSIHDIYKDWFGGEMDGFVRQGPRGKATKSLPRHFQHVYLTVEYLACLPACLSWRDGFDGGRVRTYGRPKWASFCVFSRWLMRPNWLAPILMIDNQFSKECNLKLTTLAHMLSLLGSASHSYLQVTASI